MRQLFRYVILSLVLSVSFDVAVAQGLRVGADFTTLFDNKEYSSMGFDESWTLFSSRLTPRVGVDWAERNELMVAVDMVQDIGYQAKFLSDAHLQLYYAYRAPRLKVLAGIFPREEMRGLRGPLFFDRAYCYYNNRIGGVLARFEAAKHPGAYVEFVFDYTGMRDFDTRETFMLITSAEDVIGGFRYGYDVVVGHYAKDLNPETDDGVVDNILLTPHLGYDLHLGEFDLELQLAYIQSLQRDRHFENVWLTPKGGELYVALSRWGVTLSNRLYVGDNLLSHYDRYGTDLYHGQLIYRTTEGLHNTITASYGNSFFSDTVRLEGGITFEYDGIGWGTRQWLQVSVALDYGFSKKSKE